MIWKIVLSIFLGVTLALAIWALVRTYQNSTLSSSRTWEKPLISVIIPSFNRPDFVIDAVQSVLTQTYKNVEIVVINDGSKDRKSYETLTFDPQVSIRHLNEGAAAESTQCKITIIHLGMNRGQSAARNIGLKVCRGTYVAFLDDDDVFLPDKLTVQMEAMQVKGGYVFSCTEAFIGQGIYDEKQKYPRMNQDRFRNIHTKKLGQRIPEEITLELLRKQNVIITSSVLVLKSQVDMVHGFNPEMGNGEDYDLWTRILEHNTTTASILFVRTPLLFYSESHGNGSFWKHG